MFLFGNPESEGGGGYSTTVAFMAIVNCTTAGVIRNKSWFPRPQKKVNNEAFFQMKIIITFNFGYETAHVLIINRN